MKYSLRIYSIFLLIIFAFCSEKPAQTNADTEENLRLLTYNVWYGFTINPDRKETWIAWMKDQDPDVVSLQELNEYSEDQLSADAKKWGHSYSALLKTEGFPTGVTSRYTIEDVKRILEGFHHGLLRARIKGIYFYIVHLHPSNWETRIREINLILEDINQLPEGASIILAGDFNTFSPVDSIYYSGTELEPFFHKRDTAFNANNLNKGKLDYTVIDRLLDNGFTDAEFILRPGKDQFTGSFPTLIEKPGDDGDPRKLDYIFTNQKLSDKIIRANIIINDTTSILSDHYPVVADFLLEN